jgi:hypothetical protein
MKKVNAAGLLRGAFATRVDLSLSAEINISFQISEGA